MSGLRGHSSAKAQTGTAAIVRLANGKSRDLGSNTRPSAISTVTGHQRVGAQQRQGNGRGQQQALVEQAGDTVVFVSSLLCGQPQQDSAGRGAGRHRKPRHQSGRRRPAPRRQQGDHEYGHAEREPGAELQFPERIIADRRSRRVLELARHAVKQAPMRADGAFPLALPWFVIGLEHIDANFFPVGAIEQSGNEEPLIDP